MLASALALKSRTALGGDQLQRLKDESGDACGRHIRALSQPASTPKGVRRDA
jgi:hypothetical protein